MKPAPERVRCPFCGRWVGVHATGRHNPSEPLMRWHKGTLTLGKVWCTGSGLSQGQATKLAALYAKTEGML